MTGNIYTMPRRRPATIPANEGALSDLTPRKRGCQASEVVDIGGAWGLF